MWQNTGNSPVTYHERHYTGGPKSQSQFENFNDNTELCRYAKRCHWFESCGGYHFKNVCKFSVPLTTDVHTPARTSPYTQKHNSVACARHITTQHTVCKPHYWKTRAKITQPLNIQGSNQSTAPPKRRQYFLIVLVFMFFIESNILHRPT